MCSTENETIEIKLLFEAIYLKYGYDFRDYATSSLKRRILHRLSMEGISHISEMQHRLLFDLPLFEKLLLDFSINTTEMFRDASFYRALRTEVVPFLRTYPFVKIWHAGCSTGEEVYSMAIVLKEEGLYHKSQIYATDFNERVLQKAKEGIFPVEHIQDYTINYQKAGGTKSFADYYTADYTFAVMDRSLKQNIVFANHNLAIDGEFGEMNLIVCRNVLIYFNRKLQNRAIGLFHDSLNTSGFLCLGSKESVRFSKFNDAFEDVAEQVKIYRKKWRTDDKTTTADSGFSEVSSRSRQPAAAVPFSM